MSLLRVLTTSVLALTYLVMPSAAFAQRELQVSKG